MPTWKELRRFLEHDGWKLYRTGDHYYYSKKLENGKTLYTRCSMGSGEIGHTMWQRILKRELGITQEYFNKNK